MFSTNLSRFVMPGAADVEKVTDETVNGASTARIPKIPSKQPRRP